MWSAQDKPIGSSHFSVWGLVGVDHRTYAWVSFSWRVPVINESHGRHYWVSIMLKTASVTPLLPLSHIRMTLPGENLHKLAATFSTQVWIKAGSFHEMGWKLFFPPFFLFLEAPWPVFGHVSPVMNHASDQSETGVLDSRGGHSAVCPSSPPTRPCIGRPQVAVPRRTSSLPPVPGETESPHRNGFYLVLSETSSWYLLAAIC